MEDKKEPEQTISHRYDNEQNKRVNEGRRFYKPFILRTPVLSILLVITLILIGITEIACRRLPNAPNRGVVTNVSNGVASLGVRQETGTDTALPTGGDITAVDDGTASDTATESVGQADEEPITKTRVVTSTKIIDGAEQLVIVTETFGLVPCNPQTSDGIIVASMPASNCVEFVAESAWLIVGSRIVPGPGGQPLPKTGPAEGVDGGPTQPADGFVGAATAADGQPAATNAAGAGATPLNTFAVATGTDAQAGNPSATAGTNSAGILDPSETITHGPSYTLVTGSRPTSGGSADESSPKDLPPGSVYFVFSNKQYFTGAFLPTILAILFTIPWGFVEIAAKEIEPYVQMAGSNGAGTSARNSLCLDYASTPIIFMPFKSLFHGHGIVFVASLLNILALFTAPLAAESIFIGLRGTCNANSDAAGCIPTLSVFRTSARVLEGLMTIMALFLVFLIVANRKRASGVYSNPHSLAATATLFHSLPLVEVFRSLPLEVKEKKLGTMLRGHTYGMGYYPNQDGTMSYGILLDPHGIENIHGTIECSHINLDDDYSERPSTQAWHWTLLRFIQVITFFVALIGLLGVIMYYRFVSKDSVFERFMNSQGFGVRFLFTTFGVVICQFWFYIRSIIHENEPYHNLTAGSALAKDSILIKPTPIPLLSIFRCLRRGAIFLSSIDLCTILCELLTVVLANVPYSSGNTLVAFKVCVWISTAILVIMLATLVAVMFRIGRLGGGAHVPTSVAGRMRLLLGSQMVERFRGLGDASERERDGFIEGLGERYALGKVTGWDGVDRLGVDFDECIDKS